MLLMAAAVPAIINTTKTNTASVTIKNNKIQLSFALYSVLMALIWKMISLDPCVSRLRLRLTKMTMKKMMVKMGMTATTDAVTMTPTIDMM